MGGTMCICSRPEDQESRTLISMPWFFVNKFLHSIDYANEKLGHPPNLAQIFVTMEDHFNSPVKNLYECAAVLSSL